MAGTGHRPAIGTTWLVGDIGATNARFGLVAPGGTLLHSSTHACDDFATIDDAIRAYLDARGDLPMPRVGALAIAAAITGDEIRMTNHPWSFSVRVLRERLGFERLVVINDFTAVAMAVPLLAETDRLSVGGGAPRAHRTIAMLGPGTGLGVSGLVPAGSEWIALSGEGGHVTMAPVSERENAVLDLMRARFDHVSAERCISGSGLVNLYNSLAALDGVPAASYTPAQITNPEIGQQDPLCHEATAMFCAMLGTVAGNLALSLGAQGGVYIAGGIVPKLGSRFAESAFRERFEAKGRMRSYLASIPTYVITHRLPAFLGCAAALMKQVD
jgi:glucokinase